ncbi:MAG: hypothetical protein K0S29_1217, partial [Gammaproteobacteria bacterium]|nr:hypothetical protein [Gammaproteobacteria bacterium]
MPTQAHARSVTVMEGLNVGGQYYLVEEPQTKRSVSRLIWDIAVGMLAVSGT